MGAKRKRPATRNASANKRTKIACVATGRKTNASNDADNAVQIDHPVLKHYFSRVTTLREHLASDLRERFPSATAAQVLDRLATQADHRVTNLLDSVLVGCRTSAADRRAHRERRAKDLISFTQQLPSSTIGSSAGAGPGAGAAQLEVVDFVVWLLFRRNQLVTRPQHLLAQGFDRLSAVHAQARPGGLNAVSALPSIPGIVCTFANPHVEFVTSAAWCALLRLLGPGGDIVMVDLLLECCLFLPLSPSPSDSSGSRNVRSLKQFSGVPLSSLQPCASLVAASADASVAPNRASDVALRPAAPGALTSVAQSGANTLSRLPSQIRFVRNRMFFAQPSVSANGRIKFGLHSIHVLNRYPDFRDKEQTVHVLKYIFPRQFGLHNVFTSAVDSRESALPFKDYTLREAEIKRLTMNQPRGRDSTLEQPQLKVPKRLAGDALELVGKMRKLHARCEYTQLLKYYCELSDASAALIDKGEAPSAITDLATPVSRVSAFCQAVIKKVIPKAFWGDGEEGKHNRRIVLKHVDIFLRARKFESFTLHSITDGLKVKAMSWLRLPHQQAHHNMSRSDFAKRKELIAELVYYVFDSLLVPLVRSNFHVTESNAHRNRLFYFRHDVWQAACAPALETFKSSLFEELNARSTKQRLAGRTFKYSTVRLLPKVTGFRPITNLRRRPYVWVNGRKMLGKSINAALNPAFRALNCEKATHLDDLGCSLFSVGDIYPRLKEYASRLRQLGLSGQRLYFAKVDVQACFDTIPQKSVLNVVKELLSTTEYIVANDARVKPPELTTRRRGEQSVRPIVKFSSRARPAGFIASEASVETAELSKLGSDVLVAPLNQQAYHQRQIEEMITEHVEFNLIKIGRKYYRQKNGIPQGSVLSSLLCNFFYGRLERAELRFLQNEHTCLLRLIDDFLLITTEKKLAERFLQVMHRGLPEYGVAVKPAKSLVNFDFVANDGHTKLPRADGPGFPYCGLSIDMATLELSKNGELKPGTTVSDSLTVEYSTMPGRTFRRKALNALKIQIHRMYFDTSFNSLDTALANLYRLFHDAAQRAEHYMRSMPKHASLSVETLITLRIKLSGTCLC
ncbi:hypothetical protein, variant 1 [Verruconis gallopava]|uniref:Telomerase reverse transcriptase n=1 Tax=Verruconis gallopava TaxID=253628 RepID=A0A0D1XLG7_9PEZI|nr:hypothetical protein, variant 1 [Verruconis gallopava]KIW03271.1 hypothetical protein, variant 1 [Verruconis gallopava]